jgi:hypothetical protein
MKTTTTQKRVLKRANRIAKSSGCMPLLRVDKYDDKEVVLTTWSPAGMMFDHDGGVESLHQFFTERSWKNFRAGLKKLVVSPSARRRRTTV